MANSKRITKEMRHSIKNKAMDWKFDKAEAELKALENRTAEAVFNDLFPPKIQQVFDKMPDWMLNPETSQIKLSSLIKNLIDPGKEFDLGYRGSDVYLRFAEGATKQMPMMPFGNTVCKEAFPSISLASLALLKDFLIEKDSLEKRRGAFLGRLNNLLSGISTTGKLVEVLPEAVEWIPEVLYHCSNLPQADAVAELLKI